MLKIFLILFTVLCNINCVVYAKTINKSVATKTQNARTVNSNTTKRKKQKNKNNKKNTRAKNQQQIKVSDINIVVKKDDTNKQKQINKNDKAKQNAKNTKVIDKDIMPLDLVHLIDLALQRNNNIKNSYLNVEVGKNDLNIQKSTLLPSFTANGSYVYRKDITRDIHSNGLDANISANYTIFTFGKKIDKISEVEHRLKAIKYQNNVEIQTLIHNISILYYKILSNRAELDSAIEIEKASAEALKVVSLKYKIGLAVLADKLKAKAANENDKVKILSIKNSGKALHSQLNSILNIDMKFHIFFDEPELKIRKTKKNINELLNIALENRNELHLMNEEKNAYQKELLVVKKEFLPEVSVGGKVGKLGEKKFDGDRYGEAGINITMPIFTGFSTVNEVKKINNQIKQINLNIEQKKNDISKEVVDSYNNLITGEEVYNVSLSILKSTEEHAKLTLGMYKNGKATVLDVVEANKELGEAKYQFINAKYSWLMNRIELLRVIGKMDIKNVSTIEEL